jgi:tight adherence protein C
MSAAAVACAFPLAWWAVSGGREVAQRASENLAHYQPTMRQATLERSAAERFVLPLVRTVGVRLVRFTPIGWIDSRTRLLARAGLTGRVTAEQVLGAKLVIPLLVLGVLGLQTFDQPTVRGVLLLVAFMVSGFFLPDILLRAVADRRADAIQRSLPDILDQLTISVEAGLGFEAALARITQGNPTEPLSQEFGRMLQDVQLGTGRVDALDAMAQRSQVDDLRSVVLALRQSEALGVPLARTIRELAKEMREKRRFRAEERAYRLPILLIFPLGICILPALFIVILGPAIISVVELN